MDKNTCEQCGNTGVIIGGFCGPCREEREQTRLESDSRFYPGEENHGWPGDGSGEDDLADYNQNEADDYRDE